MRRLMQARQPSPEILRHVLPLRHAALLSSPDESARRRERDFLDRSATYRQAEAADAPHPAAVATVVDGLTWELPGRAGGKHDAAPAASLRLPLEEILQTRELAVGGVMLDIGANVGMTSIPRVVLGDFDCVFAAEPDPVNYACLVRNVAANGAGGRVLPDRVAIGDRDGEVRLKLGHSGTHHLVAGDLPAGTQAVTVESLRLDTWIDRLGLDLGEVRFIKVDTQGWEPRVLAGARTTLAQKHIAWQVEFSPSMLRRAGPGPALMAEAVRAHFTHFIDLHGTSGERSRRTGELTAALAYLEERRRLYTNLLLYNASL